MTGKPDPGHADGPGTAASPSTVKRWGWLRKLIYLLLTGLVLFFVGRYLIASVGEIAWDELRLAPLPLAVGVFCLLAQHLVAGVAYSMVLAAFGKPIGLVRSSAVYWTATLGKYLPGKVATVAGGAVMLARLGIPMPVAAGTPLLMIMLTVVIGLVVSAPLLLMESVRAVLPAGWAWAVLVILIGLTCLHPRVFVRLVNIAMVRLKRETIRVKPSSGRLMAAVLLGFLRYGLLGLAVWAVARSMTNVPPGQYPVFVAVSACASVTGLLAFFAPAGIGVREGIYVAVLGPLVGPGPAALVAAGVRIIQTLVEVGAGACGVLLLKSRFTDPGPTG